MQRYYNTDESSSLSRNRPPAPTLSSPFPTPYPPDPTGLDRSSSSSSLFNLPSSRQQKPATQNNEFQRKMDHHSQSIRGTVELYQYVKQLEAELEESKIEVERKSFEAADWKSRCYEMEGKLADAFKQADKYAASAKEALTGRQHVDGSLNALKAENCDLKAKMELMEKHARQMTEEVEVVHKELLRRETLMEGKAELQRDLESAKLECDRLQQTVVTQSKEMARLRPMCERLRETEKANRHFTAEVNRLRTQRRNLLQYIHDLKKCRRTVSLWFGCLIVMVAKMHRRWTIDSSEMYRALKAQLHGVRSELTSCEGEKVILLSRVGNANEEIMRSEMKLQETLTELSASKQEVKGSFRKMADLSREIENAYSEIKQRDVTIGELQRTIEAAKQLESKSLENMRDALRGYQTEYTAYVESSQREAAEMKAAQDEEIRNLKTRIRRLDVEHLEATSVVRDEAMKEIADFRVDSLRKIEEMKENLKSQHLREVHSYQDKMRNLESEVQQYKTQIITLEGELNRCLVIIQQSSAHHLSHLKDIGHEGEILRGEVDVYRYKEMEAIRRAEEAERRLQAHLEGSATAGTVMHPSIVFSPSKQEHPVVVVTPQTLQTPALPQQQHLPPGSQQYDATTHSQMEEWRSRCNTLDKELIALKSQRDIQSDEYEKIKASYAAHLQQCDREKNSLQDRLDVLQAKQALMEQQAREKVIHAKSMEERNQRLVALDNRLQHHEAQYVDYKTIARDFHRLVLEAVRRAESEWDVATIPFRHPRHISLLNNDVGSSSPVTVMGDVVKGIQTLSNQLRHFQSVIRLHIDNEVRLDRGLSNVLKNNKEMEIRIWEMTEQKVTSEDGIVEEKKSRLHQLDHEAEVRRKESDHVAKQHVEYLSRCEMEVANLCKYLEGLCNEVMSVLRGGGGSASTKDAFASPPRPQTTVTVTNLNPTSTSTPTTTKWITDELQVVIQSLLSNSNSNREMLSPESRNALIRLESDLNETTQRRAELKHKSLAMKKHHEEKCKAAGNDMIQDSHLWAQRISVFENELDQRQADADEGRDTFDSHHLIIAQQQVELARRDSVQSAATHYERFMSYVREAEADIQQVEKEYSEATSKIFRIHTDMLREIVQVTAAQGGSNMNSEQEKLAHTLTKVYTALVTGGAGGGGSVGDGLSTTFDMILELKRNLCEYAGRLDVNQSRGILLQQYEMNMITLVGQCSMYELERKMTNFHTESALQRVSARNDAEKRALVRECDKKVARMRKEHEAALQTVLAEMKF